VIGRFTGKTAKVSSLHKYKEAHKLDLLSFQLVWNLSFKIEFTKVPRDKRKLFDLVLCGSIFDEMSLSINGSD
jgi:hypothetical protein